MTVFIADDHKNMINSLKIITEFAFEKTVDLTFIESYNCEAAYHKIRESVQAKSKINLAILDFMMPPFYEKNIKNGGDICLLLKKEMPDCKVVINTGLLEDFVLFEIDQKVKPDALILKSDLGADDYINVLKQVIEGKKYRSEYVIEKVAKIWETEIFANEQNRSIVVLMANGYKIKEIADQIALSETAVNKRILKIKKTLNITEDTSILREVKRRGYI